MPADVHAEDLPGAGLGLVRRARELDAAGLPATADEHLCLDDDRTAELLGGDSRLGGARREDSVRDGNPVSPKELLALILVQVQSARESTASTRHAPRAHASITG